MLQTHRAARADVLVDALATALAEPCDDPLAPDLVAVHSRGIERWVLQRLAGRLGSSGEGDGVGANIEFPFPGRLVADVLWRLAGHDPDTDADPWRPARLTWPLLELLDTAAGDDALAPLHRQLEDAPERRFGLARHLADLFDRYSAHRPEMIRAWHGGADLDGTGATLRDADRWQAALWRAVRVRVGVPSPAERLALLPELDDAEVRAGLRLPGRFHAFGLTAVPAAYVDVLAALGRHFDVGLWLLHPSTAMWHGVTGSPGPARGPRRHDGSGQRVRHPLLRSWARDVRELQRVVAATGAHVTHHELPDGATSVLSVLQAGIRADAPPPGRPPAGATVAQDRRTVVDGDDASVQVHGCWGTERQVEVLRDEILRLLAADPTLEPRDVIVMCPDIERYAPLVQAVLTHVDTEVTGLPDLRVRLADRSLQRVNPVLRVLDELLALVADRCTVSQIRELAGRAPVARRFRFSAEDLERIGRWIDDLGVRWGLDLEHRAAHGLPGISARTWRSALDRLLLGVALADTDDRVVGGVAPYDEVTADVELAGRFAEFVDRIGWAVDQLADPRTVEQWRQTLLELIDAFALLPGDEEVAMDELGRVLDGLVDEAAGVHDATRSGATGAGAHAPLLLSLAELRDALDGRLGGRPGRANHRTGDLTVCTLVPMRAVPHRVVCLLGIDDGVFPRRTTTDGDDLLDRDPFVGDRDPRTEDRQLLLDALLSARDAVIVTYTARDPRTGVERPPAVPVAELCAVVRDTVRTADGADVPVERHQPLQAHAAAAFDGSRPRGYDRVALATARAALAEHRVAEPLVSLPFPDEPLTEVTLAELSAFVEHPVRAFVRHRLATYLEEVDDVVDETVPAALDNLTTWQVRDERLRRRRLGTEERWERHLRGRDLLPPGRLGEDVLTESGEFVDRLLHVARDRIGEADVPRAVPVELTVDGVRLRGEVPDVVAPGQILVMTPSKIGAKHRLRVWVSLVAATATNPETPWRATLVGRRPSNGKELLAVDLPPFSDDAEVRRRLAEEHLVLLLDLLRRGRTTPLPLFCATSHAFEVALRDGASTVGAVAKAGKQWEEDAFAPEQADPHHRLAFGVDTSISDLLAGRGGTAACPSEWPGGSSAFERYARRLWTPILDACEETPYTERKLRSLQEDAA